MKLAIVTRNATHGGVETQVHLQQEFFGATVFVAGGANLRDTCPFRYDYVETRAELQRRLAGFDAVLYHWPPPWAVEAIRDSGIPSVEYVHRADTSECDKSVPSRIVTHSPNLAEHVIETYRRACEVVPLMLDVERIPERPLGDAIGGMTTYDRAKGLDLLLAAWERIQDRFPKQVVRCYGIGVELGALRELTARRRLQRVELRDPVRDAAAHLGEFSLYVVPSRNEGMPVAILEALAANIPVICSDLEGMRDFNRLAGDRGREAPLTLVARESVDELAAAMTSALSAPRRIDTRSYLRQFYAVESVGPLLRRALQKAIDVPPRPAAVESAPRTAAELATLARELGRLVEESFSLKWMRRMAGARARLFGERPSAVGRLEALRARLEDLSKKL